jgi:pyruvate ferredoxin oxidoreductase delta subunit
MKTRIDINTPWQDMTIGGEIYEPANSMDFNTGEWRRSRPITDWDKCTHCLFCVPFCPDSSIPVKNGARLDFDYDHCKGCGICAKACPFKAISMEMEG